MMRASGGYNPAAVAITGGTIDGTPIGATTPGAITGTTVTATTKLLTASGTSSAVGLSFAGLGNTSTYGIFSPGSTQIAIQASANNGLDVYPGNIVAVNSSFGFGTSYGTQDLVLNRDAANTLAQRNGTAAQAFNLYNTYTDASNYERGVFDWGSTPNVLTIGTANAGTGAARDVYLSASSANIYFRTGGTFRAAVTGNDLRPFANGALDLGSSTTGWKRLYIDYTNTGTVGNVTINKASGRVNMAAAGTSFMVTNSLVTAASKIFLNADSAPGNVVAVQFYAVAAAGSFTVNAVPAVTNQTAVDFLVINAD